MQKAFAFSNSTFPLIRTTVFCNAKSSGKFQISSRFSMMSCDKSVLIAVCQLNCTSDRAKNFETCKKFIGTAVEHQAKMVFFPECFDHVGESKKQSIDLSEPLDGDLLSRYKQIAQDKSVWLSLGGFHEKGSVEDPNRVYNSHVIINNSGEIVAVYRKIHLFDIDVPGGVRLKESDYTIPGKEIIPAVESPIGKIGLGICYDLRFPEFSLSLMKSGAEILTYPSAFTQTTGMAHWEPLLRCRAIECQSYVIAAAQTGCHNPKRTSYGHAMVVDPWGSVIACCGDNVGIAYANINLENISRIRSQMPVMMHRRTELYGDIVTADNYHDISEPSYMFGSIEVLSSFVFYKTKYSIAFVNRKCILPGHVLVCPVRCAKRFSDLSSVEVADLFICVQTVQEVIEKVHKASSSTIAIQDGPDAGQTVQHVHVHIVPRKCQDFQKNDDIYEKLETHDKSEEGWRSIEEMTIESLQLRNYFHSSK